MKKLFEKYPIINYTIVLTIVAIACGLLIGGINAWTAPIIEQNEYDRKIAAYQAVLPEVDLVTVLDTSDDPSNIVEKVEATNDIGEVIGYIINIDQTNGYGNMQIVMAIGSDGVVISAQFLQLNQTLNLDNTRANLQMYVGQNINATADYDFLSGATRSLETLTAMMLDVKTAFNNIDIESPVDEAAVRLARYQDLLAETASFTELDSSTDPTSVLVKAELKDASDVVIGYAIEAAASNGFGSLHTVIVTDTDGVIVGADFVELDQSLYTDRTESNLQLYVGTTLTDETADGTFQTGATYSLTTLEALIADSSAAFSHIDTEGAGA